MNSNNKNLIWFLIGISSLSILLGFLTGASSSPVAGVVITSAFGLVAAVFGLYHKISIEKKLELINLSNQRDNAQDQSETEYESANRNYENIEPSFYVSLNKVGQLLAVFSVMFLVGLSCGISIRIGDWLAPSIKIKQLPWVGSNEPTQTESAIDWVIVQEKLLRLGYSEEQVKIIYKIDQSLSKKSGEDRRVVLNTLTYKYIDQPLSLLFDSNESCENSKKNASEKADSESKAVVDNPTKLHGDDG